MSSSATRFPAVPLVGRREGSLSIPQDRNACIHVPSDELLLSRIATGEPEEAIVLLFRRYSSLVRGIAQRLLRDPGEAEDLVQEVFLYIQRRAALFDHSKSSARSWMVQIVYYQAIARRRYLATRHGLSQHECRETRDPEPIDSIHTNGLSFDRAVVSEILESLTEAQQETLRLFFFEGYTLSEISAKLGQPLGNVRHHYYRGLARLRARLLLK
jgi:RNA polymerase sigma-70 factor (ECF subfamily)